MSNFKRIILPLLLATLATLPVRAQDNWPELAPHRPVTFSLSPEEARIFTLPMKRDGVAEITLLVNESLVLSFGFFDEAGKTLEAGNTSDASSAIFIAPRDGRYKFGLKLEKSPDVSGPQNISLEYKDSYKPPAKTRQKDVRSINGYTIKILTVPEVGGETGSSIVLIEKGGKLKKILRSESNADYTGFSFPDSETGLRSAVKKRVPSLIGATLDKTGDGIPDIMVDHFSGGAHCCFSTYFINLGDSAELVEVIETEHAGMRAIGKNPKGGLRFKTNENTFAYWNISFAGSPLPEVILEFTEGKLRPNFNLMKKPPPSLDSLRTKARVAQRKIGLEPYSEEDGYFEEAFWDEMLDLIYSGNETLAWQYFDLVWPVKKPGKEIFRRNFKEQLATGYYGTGTINTSTSFQNFQQAFERALRNNQ